MDAPRPQWVKPLKPTRALLVRPSAGRRSTGHRLRWRDGPRSCPHSQTPGGNTASRAARLFHHPAEAGTCRRTRGTGPRSRAWSVAPIHGAGAEALVHAPGSEALPCTPPPRSPVFEPTTPAPRRPGIGAACGRSSEHVAQLSISIMPSSPATADNARARPAHQSSDRENPLLEGSRSGATFFAAAGSRGVHPAPRRAGLALEGWVPATRRAPACQLHPPTCPACHPSQHNEPP
jgi:hypothetical protein